jgi:putative acetyltransferase
VDEMIEIKRANPHDFGALLNDRDIYIASLYPPESNHLLDVESLCQPQMHFYGATIDGELKACGGFWAHGDYVEIKSLYVDPSARGQGLGRKLMGAIEQHAKTAGFKIARLETGIYQPEARALYEKLGYKYRAPFGEYKLDPLSVFMEKAL